jgi:outer membrane protein assembly factor BamB
VAVVVLLLAAPAAGARDWPRFGYDAARSNSGPTHTGITKANLGRLRHTAIALDGTVDSSPIYLSGVDAGGARRDIFVVTTSYGKTIAVDANSGAIVWEFTPSDISVYEGSAQITQGTPVADPSRRYVYSISPNGVIHKLSVGDGSEVQQDGWPAIATRDPAHEKVGVPLNLYGNYVLATTGGYLGDAPPYQGHVVVLARATGRQVGVWNSLCSDQQSLLLPSQCDDGSGSAIWGRAAPVVVPGTHVLLVTTGNGGFDGHTAWGDSVLELSPNAHDLLQNFTPRNQASLERGDVDLGSTAPAYLPGRKRLALQAGKEGAMYLLDLDMLNGRSPRAGPLKGGELQKLSAPGSSGVFTAPAVWRVRGTTWAFVTSTSATAGYVLGKGRNPRLRRRWLRNTPGTSPVVAGGLLWVFDPAGTLRVFEPKTGRPVGELAAGPGHWNSPIVIDGHVALPDGDANAHGKAGTLHLWSR